MSAPTKVAIGMRTIDRSPRTNYLGETLANLARAGVFRSPHFLSIDIVDSGSEDSHGHFMDQVVPNVQGIRSSHALRFHHGDFTPNACATEAHRKVEESGGADWVMFLEDDVDVCADFLESVVAWLDDHAVDEVPFYPMAACYPQVSRAVAEGLSAWYQYPPGAYYGTQCYVVPAAINGDLVEWLDDHRLPRCAPPGCDERGHDLRFHDWASDLGVERFITPAPSLVQHIGEDTAMGCKFYQFRSWPGRGWSYVRQVGREQRTETQEIRL